MPPNFRVVEVSACEKASKIDVSFGLRNSNAGILDRDSERRARLAALDPRHTDRPDRAA